MDKKIYNDQYAGLMKLLKEEDGSLSPAVIKTNLIGSYENVEVGPEDNQTVESSLPVLGYSYIWVAVTTDVQHHFSSRYRGKVMHGGSSGFNEIVTRSVTLLEVLSDDRGSGQYMEIPGTHIELQMRNFDDQSHSYNVHVFGVR